MSIAEHSTCGTHRGYRLSCKEFDDLMSSGRCHMCGQRSTALELDHDHHLGSWAVRGALCGSCNVSLGFMQCGKKLVTPEAKRYLADPWHARQRTTEAKRRRAMPVTNCPACDHLCGIKKDGTPTVHWSRHPDHYDEICSGAA